MQNPSHQITFKTTQKCPDNFDAWTFFWTFPKIDKNAHLEYLVLKPNGKTYCHWKLRDHTRKNPKYNEPCQSDFGKDFVGGHPRCFYHQKLEITFMVNKGKIKFDPKKVKNFKFHFSKTVKSVTQQH